MRTVLHKWFWVWDFDKEEQWLNEMSAKGLALVGVGFCRYEFESCEPGAYNFKLEMLDHDPGHPESRKYITFIEETGAEQVGSLLRWVYFRKAADAQPFELFSDYESRVNHLKRILFLLGLLIGFNIWCVLYNLWCVFYFGSLFNLTCLVNLGICVPLLLGYRKINRKKQQYMQEQVIFE